jgi:hypothetical protein
MSDQNRPDAIIVDIDGTIADITHRAHFVNTLGKKDWDSFNANMHLDAPKAEIINIIKRLEQTGLAILLVTGRFSKFRKVTIEWLVENDMIWNALIMRPNNDYRSDHIIKRELYHEIIYPKFNVVGVFDDRDSVVDMWRKEGLTCLQVQKGDY